ncbi:MAG: sugar porter family MFS transporter [Armatimonadetes bacterium]|nr:sugar porter family MFS transporter [Armatimonadota bacterium]
MAGPVILRKPGAAGPAPPIRPIVWIVALAAATAGLLFGLDVGVISGAQAFLQKDFAAQGFTVTDRTLEYIVSALLVGATVGAISCGWLSSALGRKPTLVLAAVGFVIGCLGCSLATSPAMLIGMRLFLGLAVGMASFVAPLYLAEVAPQSLRGALVSMYQLMITIGILVAFLSDTYFGGYAVIGGVTGGHWRWMLGVLVVPALLMLFAVSTLPRSPRWLMMKGREAEARAVLERVRATEEEVATEIEEVKKDLAVPQNGLSLFLQNPNFRRAVYLGISLQMIQQLTGINVFIYYSPRIIAEAGFSSTSEQLWGNVLVGLTNVLATFIAIAFVDRVGRKPIMYAGFVTMGAATATMGILFRSEGGGGFLAIGALLVFIIGFAMSAGPIVWILCSEIYPLNGRDFGITVSTATNWIVNAIVGFTFLTMLNSLGPSNTFLCYASLEILFILFFMRFVPETKGVSLEHIAENLLEGKPLRHIGLSRTETAAS